MWRNSQWNTKVWNIVGCNILGVKWVKNVGSIIAHFDVKVKCTQFRIQNRKWKSWHFKIYNFWELCVKPQIIHVLLRAWAVLLNIVTHHEHYTCFKIDKVVVWTVKYLTVYIFLRFTLSSKNHSLRHRDGFAAANNSFISLCSLIFYLCCWSCDYLVGLKLGGNTICMAVLL